MKIKEELRDELKTISPFLLEKREEPEGFDVPRDYFKSLPDEVFRKLNEHPKMVVEEKINWLDQLLNSIQYYFQPRYAIAFASAALLLAAGFYFLNNNGANTEKPQLAQAILDGVPDDILQTYVSENIDEFDESILTAELADHSSELLPELKLDISDDLMDELIDVMDIDDLDDLL